ncbi:MAG: hypothetical protein H6Q87_1946, partial [candidate division NC10 bacterium]|nr:hypothetical protein [candidate division NC10 bacterium]
MRLTAAALAFLCQLVAACAAG